jgi:hypothetical protein
MIWDVLGVGLSAWLRNGFTSATELVATWRADRGQWDRIFARSRASIGSFKGAIRTVEHEDSGDVLLNS